MTPQELQAYYDKQIRSFGTHLALDKREDVLPALKATTTRELLDLVKLMEKVKTGAEGVDILALAIGRIMSTGALSKLFHKMSDQDWDAWIDLVDKEITQARLRMALQEF
jgi:hypothetical protein